MDQCPACSGKVRIEKDKLYTIGSREPEEIIKSKYCEDCGRGVPPNSEEIICEWDK